jgi:hypothetical protein
MAIRRKKSGVPTCPLDGVTFIRTGYKYFKYLNLIYFFYFVCIEPMAIRLKNSGVPTCPLDGVTFIRTGYKHFKYLN